MLDAIRDKKEISEETGDKLKAAVEQLRQGLRAKDSRVTAADAQPERPPQPHRLGQGDAEDHQGHADGGRGEAAPRAGGGRGGAALRRAHGRGARQSRHRAARPRRRPAAAGRHRQGHTSICSSSAPPSAACAAPSTRPSSGSPASTPTGCWPTARRSRSSASARRATTACGALYAPQIIERRRLRGVKQLSLRACRAVADKILALFADGRVRRRDAVLLAVQVGDQPDADRASRSSRRRSRRRRPPAQAALGGAVYEYEPDEDEILADLLPRNIAMQIFKALLENAASEQGARMSAMDNATRNAGDMIDRLT